MALAPGQRHPQRPRQGQRGRQQPARPSTWPAITLRSTDLNNGLSGGGTVDSTVVGTPTLTVGGNNATSTFSGTIQNTAGTLSLTKIGTGTTTLSGTLNYGGWTTVQAGTLRRVGAGDSDCCRACWRAAAVWTFRAAKPFWTTPASLNTVVEGITITPKT